MRRLFVFAVLGLFLSVSLSACGRKAMPEFPDDSTYPVTYPNHK